MGVSYCFCAAWYQMTHRPGPVLVDDPEVGDIPPTRQRWAMNAAERLTWPRWGGRTAPAASAAPPLWPWTLGGHSGPPGPARFSEPQTFRSLCPEPCRRSHKPHLQFQPVSRRGCWCPGPWLPPNRLRDKQVVGRDTQVIARKSDLV